VKPPGARSRAKAAILAVLPRATDVEVLPGDDDSSHDLVLAGHPVRVQWIGEGHLGNVLSLIREDGRQPDIVVARQLSPGARKALADARMGWVDESGAAEIAIGTILVSRTGRPVSTERPAGWTTAVLATAEVLLCGTTATVDSVARETGLSTGSATASLRFLTDLGLLTAAARRGRGSRRHLEDPKRLLDEYAMAAAALRKPLAVQVGVMWRDPIAGIAGIGGIWSSQGYSWAATGGVAAALLAPHLTAQATAEVYVDADTVVGLEGVAAAADLRPIEGGRLTLRPFPTVAVTRLTRDIDGIAVAPWPRVYADVRTSGVRGEEAAEHLAEVMNGGRS
jgi:hypothetical protein